MNSRFKFLLVYVFQLAVGSRVGVGVGWVNAVGVGWGFVVVLFVIRSLKATKMIAITRRTTDTITSFCGIFLFGCSGTGVG